MERAAAVLVPGNPSPDGAVRNCLIVPQDVSTANGFTMILNDFSQSAKAVVNSSQKGV
jgi:hypothetical protein